MKVSDLIPETDALILNDYYERKNILVQHETGRGITADRAIRDARVNLSEINWEYASIERMNNKEITSSLMTFNLGKAIKQKDPEHNLELQAGDVVTIFGINDIPVAKEKRTQFVKVSGEVKAPGIYQIKNGTTLADIIQKAGGLASDAYLYGTVFTRETTRTQQQANLDQAVRKLEAQITSQTTTSLQNVNGSDNMQSLQGQLLAQRMTLEKLKGLRASGRIALEIDFHSKDLPSIDLEDGDVVYVPSRPSFVSVFGAVLSENTFIHKPGFSVSDYLERAGVTREADLDAIMVIRSDGTVFSNGAQRNWFGFGNMKFMSTKIYPGDSVFVPEVVDRRTAYTQLIQGVKDWTQMLYQFGLGVAAIKTLRN
jgi:protein involved in polysaccharide export with SLBB domain